MWAPQAAGVLPSPQYTGGSARCAGQAPCGRAGIRSNVAQVGPVQPAWQRQRPDAASQRPVSSQSRSVAQRKAAAARA